MLVIKAYNIRDAGGNSDVQLSINGIDIAGAFDNYDLDGGGPGVGISQDYSFPLTGALRDSLLGGNGAVVVQHDATDGQFIAIDAVSLGLDTVESEAATPAADAGARAILTLLLLATAAMVLRLRMRPES